MKQAILSTLACLWLLSLMLAAFYAAPDVMQIPLAIGCAMIACMGVVVLSLPPTESAAVSVPVIVVFGLAAQWFAWVPA